MLNEGIVTGKVFMYGENTRAWHIQNGENEIIVHDAPDLNVGDNVVVDYNRKLQLAINTFVVWAVEVAIEPKPDPVRYYTDEEVAIMAAAQEIMVACGMDEDLAWDLSYEVIVVKKAEDWLQIAMAC